MKEPLMDSIFRVRELTNTIANFTYMCLIVCWKEQLSTHHRRNLLFIEIIDLIYVISPLALSKAPMARSIYKLASSAIDDGSEREPCSIDTTCSARHGDQRARRRIALSPLSATTMLCCRFEFDRGRKLQEETVSNTTLYRAQPHTVLEITTYTVLEITTHELVTRTRGLLRLVQ